MDATNTIEEPNEQTESVSATIPPQINLKQVYFSKRFIK
jgi:hypothetical protein